MIKILSIRLSIKIYEPSRLWLPEEQCLWKCLSVKEAIWAPWCLTTMVKLVAYCLLHLHIIKKH